MFRDIRVRVLDRRVIVEKTVASGQTRERVVVRIAAAAAYADSDAYLRAMRNDCLQEQPVRTPQFAERRELGRKGNDATAAVNHGANEPADAGFSV